MRETNIREERAMNRYRTHKQISEMMERGWRMDFGDYHDMPSDIVNRLEQKYGKGNAKVYYTSTRIRGFYDTVVLIKTSSSRRV